MVDDLIGAGAQEQAVLGETTNLAARLQAIGEPGVAMIESSTRRFIRSQHANAYGDGSRKLRRSRRFHNFEQGQQVRACYELLEVLPVDLASRFR